MGNIEHCRALEVIRDASPHVEAKILRAIAAEALDGREATEDDALASQLWGAVEALEAIRDHGKVEGHECWALHQGDCAEVFQEIARSTLDRLGGQ